MKRILLMAVAAIAFAATLIGGRSAAAHRLSGCALNAMTPVVSGGSGHALANLSGCSAPMPYTIRFATSGGTSLRQNSGTAAFGSIFTSPDANCSGLSVHSFLTVNDDGTNKSDTSGNISC